MNKKFISYILLIAILLTPLNTATSFYNINNKKDGVYYDKLGDSIFNNNLKNGNSVYFEELINNTKNKNLGYRNGGVTLDTGDILIFHGIEKEVWNPTNKWNHAVVIYDEYIVEAYPGRKSQKISLYEYLNSNRINNYDKVLIVNMQLTNKEKEDFKKYIDNNLIGKPYPRYREILFTKYSMDKFYCSSLIWRGHLESGKKIDLDYDTPDIVWPIELALSNPLNLISGRFR